MAFDFNFYYFENSAFDILWELFFNGIKINCNALEAFLKHLGVY